jgi:hypothetical protein
MDEHWDPVRQQWVRSGKSGLTQGQIVAAIVAAAVIIAIGWWVWGEIELAMFIADCEADGGVAKVWTITGQKFCAHD